MTNLQKYAQLHKILWEAFVYRRAVGKLEFDMQCCAPKDGMEPAGADMAVLADRHFRLTHSKRFSTLVTELYAEDGTPIPAAPHPSMIFFCRVPFDVHPGDILRAGDAKGFTPRAPEPKKC